MLAAIPAIVALLAQIAPTLATTGAIGAAIDAIVALAPSVVKGFPVLVSTVKGIIATLRGNPLVTPEQMASLDAAEAVIDSDYDAAAAAAKAEDASANQG